MKANVDKDICIGCGLCPEVCSEVFEMDDDDGKAVASSDDLKENLLNSAKDAEEQCPVNAISLE